MLNSALPAFVLHSRAYRESSALVDFLTPQGRIRAVMRSARGKSGSLARAFVPLEIELRGRGELKSIARLEAAGVPNLLLGYELFSGLYLNELLIRLLPAEDPHPAVFDHYAATLLALAEGRPLEPLLRALEWRLLDDLGATLVLHDLGEPRAGRWLEPGWAAMRLDTLSPMTVMASGGGPMKVTPISVMAWAKSVFSEKKP